MNKRAKIKIPRTLTEARKVAGSATCKKRVKQYETVSFKLSLFKKKKKSQWRQQLKCPPQNYITEPGRQTPAHHTVYPSAVRYAHLSFSQFHICPHISSNLRTFFTLFPPLCHNLFLALYRVESWVIDTQTNGGERIYKHISDALERRIPVSYVKFYRGKVLFNQPRWGFPVSHGEVAPPRSTSRGWQTRGGGVQRLAERN